MATPPGTADLVGSSPVRHARTAGLVGVVTLASGTFAGSVASRLVVRGDPVATSAEIVASDTLFRLGAVGSLTMMVAFLLYALLLYRLLRPVDEGQAGLMMGLVLASVPLYMLTQAFQLAALDPAARQAYGQVELLLELHRLGGLVSAIFFGLWLFPLGLLVYRSGFLPRILGVALMVGTLGYLVLFVQGLFFEATGRTLWSNPFLVVTHLSEAALMLWLLIRGVNVERWARGPGA